MATLFSGNSVKKKKESKSFYTVLLLSFLAVSIFSTLLLTVILSANYLKASTSSAGSYSQQVLSQTNYALNQMDENVDRLSVSLLSNTGVTAFLSLNDYYGNVPVTAGHILDEQMMVLPYVENIYLYNSALDLVYSAKTGTQQPLAESEDPEILSRLQDPSFVEQYDGSPVPSGKNSETSSYEYFTYYIFDTHSTSNGVPSAIVINLYTSTLTESIRSMKQLGSANDTCFMVLDENRHYLTGSPDPAFLENRDWVEPVLNEIDSHPGESSFISINGVPYLQTNTCANTNDWYLLNFTPASLLIKPMLTTALSGILIFIVILMITCFVCSLLAKRLNSPFQSLERLVKESGKIPKETSHSHPREVQTILSAISSLQENNAKLRSLQNETRYSLIQSFLNKLVSNQQPDSPLMISRELNRLNLNYLETERLCMVVLKIDRYQEFVSSSDSDKLWAMRFSVANITEEIVSPKYTCNVFSRGDDKVVLLLACGWNEEDPENLKKNLLSLFASIQESVSFFLHFTVTIAYSSPFQGIKRIPSVYKNLENALLLKMRFGHNSIIPSWKLDDTTTESFHLSSRTLTKLLDCLADGNLSEAKDTWQSLTNGIYDFNYNEVISTLIHAGYSIYERMSEKYPMIKESLTTALKTFLSKVQTAEVKEDIQAICEDYLGTICALTLKLKEDPAGQTSSVITQKIVQIVQRDYADPSLCLSSIADEMELSSNYIGHIFRQNMQKSVAQYLLELRMDKVAQYLQTTDYPLQKILDLTGLERNNYFYSKFKKHFGLSLTEYRQIHCNASLEESTESPND